VVVAVVMAVGLTGALLGLHGGQKRLVLLRGVGLTASGRGLAETGDQRRIRAGRVAGSSGQILFDAGQDGRRR
jgi:hypothetical protein